MSKNSNTNGISNDTLAAISDDIRRVLTDCSKELFEKLPEEFHDEIKEVFEKHLPKASKSKKKSAGDKPKRLPNAYNLFYKEQRPIVLEKNPNADNKQIMQLIAKMWKERPATPAAAPPAADKLPVPTTGTAKSVVTVAPTKVAAAKK